MAKGNAVETTERPYGPAPTYDDAQRVRAFTALMRYGGDAKKATAELALEGLDLEPDTLLEWRDRSYPAMYVALAEEQGRAIEEMVAARLRENALRATSLESTLLEKIESSTEGCSDITDLAKALDAVQKARSSGVDRTLSLTGRPVDGKGPVDPRKIMTELQELFAKAAATEGEAVEEAVEA